MRISEPIRTRRGFSLTPLVDVVFLLVMFFMLSSTFSKFSPLDIGRQSSAAGAAESPAAAEGAGIRGVIISVSANAAVRVNGEEIALKDLVAMLDSLHAKGARTAIVVADSGATVQDLVSALEQARTSQIGAIAISR